MYSQAIAIIDSMVQGRYSGNQSATFHQTPNIVSDKDSHEPEEEEVMTVDDCFDDDEELDEVECV